MNNIGIYIHVPFCAGKCPYCDFYSRLPSPQAAEAYVLAVEKSLTAFAAKYPDRLVDTVYFGGGTPSLLGGELLCRLLKAVKANFTVTADAEVTLEANPGSVDQNFFDTIKVGGFNRLSMGLQSANEEELKFLGRKHSAEDAAKAVKMARKAGFDNISLDLMMGLPGQTEELLAKSIDFCAALDVEHISSYILKIEENTPFGRQNIILPDEDDVSDLYLFAVERLAEKGYPQYEISNFAKEGLFSRHNTRYWKCSEYIGIGPSAHSYMEGKRFYFGRSTEDFLAGKEPIPDGEGGSFEEFVMLGLRLTEGISKVDCDTFGENNFALLLKKAQKIPRNLIKTSEDNIALTKEGFLLSNTIIAMLVE